MAEVVIGGLISGLIVGGVVGGAAYGAVGEDLRQKSEAASEAKDRSKANRAKEAELLRQESDKKKLSEATAQRDKETSAGAAAARVSGGGRGTILTSPIGTLDSAYGGNTAIGGK